MRRENWKPGLSVLLLAAACAHGQAVAPPVDERDGRGTYVFAEIASEQELERDARLRGKLDAPVGGALPGGVLARRPRTVRVATVNIHMGVPGDEGLDPANERIEALRDVARFVSAVDADVVLVQELRDRPFVEGRPGISRTASVLARLIEADAMAFTPAIERDPLRDPLKYYGTAVYTRNGYGIERAANVALPNAGPEIEPRSAGIVAVKPPAGEPFTVVSTHLANRVVEDQPLRDEQLSALRAVVEGLARDGQLTYREAIGGRSLTAGGFPGKRLILGGDLNQKQPPSDLALRGGGLTHVNDLLEAKGPAGAARAVAAKVDTASAPGGGGHRIDHLYAAGLEVLDVAVAEIPSNELAGRPPTDHKAILVDFLLEGAGAAD